MGISKKQRKIKFKDVTGQKGGFLTAVRFIEKRKDSYYWLFKCDCGGEKILNRSRVLGTKNLTKSCGCIGKEKINQLNIKRHRKNYMHTGHVYRSYKQGAEKRNLEWDILPQHLEYLIFQDCFYCGRPATKGTIAKDRKYKLQPTQKRNGIDRIDNSLGYNLNNVVTCCYICNRAKSFMGYKEFIEYLDDLVEYRHNLNVFTKEFEIILGDKLIR